MPKRHLVELADEQRAGLDRREAGPLTRRRRNRVRVLLRADGTSVAGEGLAMRSLVSAVA